MYRLNSVDAGRENLRVQLLGSGAILRCVLDAQRLLADEFGVSSDVWSVTSYTQLRREARECYRHNLLHPTATPQKSYLETMLGSITDPVIATSDYVCAVAEQIAPWVPGGMFALGTDGMGRSETRKALRRHFEVDAECIAIAALYQLSRTGAVKPSVVQSAIEQLGVDPEKTSPLYA
jgi:pyruvate dehydrogenase E1 component